MKSEKIMVPKTKQSFVLTKKCTTDYLESGLYKELEKLFLFIDRVMKSEGRTNSVEPLFLAHYVGGIKI